MTLINRDDFVAVKEFWRARMTSPWSKGRETPENGRDAGLGALDSKVTLLKYIKCRMFDLTLPEVAITLAMIPLSIKSRMQEF